MDMSLHRPAGSPTLTTTWDEAVSILKTHAIPTIAPLVSFVESVAASPYAAGLFPSPGVFQFLIGRIPAFPANEPHLVVMYDRERRQFEFSYVVDPYSCQIWNTKAPVSRVFQHFEHLMLRRLRWFSRPVALARSNKSLERTREG